MLKVSTLFLTMTFTYSYWCRWNISFLRLRMTMPSSMPIPTLTKFPAIQFSTANLLMMNPAWSLLFDKVRIEIHGGSLMTFYHIFKTIWPTMILQSTRLDPASSLCDCGIQVWMAIGAGRLIILVSEYFTEVEPGSGVVDILPETLTNSSNFSVEIYQPDFFQDK